MPNAIGAEHGLGRAVSADPAGQGGGSNVNICQQGGGPQKQSVFLRSFGLICAHLALAPMT
jgi:hypothetical protein